VLSHRLAISPPSPANPLFLACRVKMFFSFTREREELETIEDLVWAETTMFGSSETTRNVAVAEDVKSLVRFIMKAKSGPKPQE